MMERVLDALQKVAGREVWVTLAFGDLLLAKVDMVLEDVLFEEGRVSLTGSFNDSDEKIVYREVGLPADEDDEVEVATFADEVRITTTHGFFLEVVPI